MDTSAQRSSMQLVGAAIVVALFGLTLGCARSKAVAPASAVAPDAASTEEPGGASTLDVDASGGDFQVSGTIDLSGAIPQGNEAGAVGEAMSKGNVGQICFAPNSAKLPADTSAQLEAAAKALRTKKSERKRLTVEPMITPRDSQSTASKIRGQRTAAIVGALVKKGLDRKVIVVTGPEVPHTEWSMGSMFGASSMFGEEGPAPCVELAIVTKETTQGGSL